MENQRFAEVFQDLRSRIDEQSFASRIWDQAEADINCMRQPLYPCLQKQLIASYREQFNSSAMNFGTRNGEIDFLDSKRLFCARLWSRINGHFAKWLVGFFRIRKAILSAHDSAQDECIYPCMFRFLRYCIRIRS